MLIRHPNMFRVSIALLVIGIALLIIPPYKQYCQYDHANKYYCSAYEIVVTLVEFVERYNGFFLFLATLAIAWFTWTVQNSTQKLWTATKHSTEALINIEKAQLFITIKKDNIIDLVKQYGRSDQSEFESDVESPSISYQISNIGRTAAIIDELGTYIIIERNFPNDIDYRIEIPPNPVLKQNETSDIFDALMKETCTRGHCVKIQKRQTTFWFDGYIKFDDTFRRKWICEYRFRFDRGYSRWRIVHCRSREIPKTKEE